MTTLSAAIMAHPVRADYVRDLVKVLDREVEICWDENPVPSRDPAQRWATGRAAWSAYDPAADWHLVLQDDVVVSRDLLAGLERALAHFGPPQGLVSAYAGTGRPDQANVRKAIAAAWEGEHAWFSTRSLNWGPAIIAPTHTIPEMLRWCSGPRWTRARVANYDYRIGVYYRDRLRWRTWYTMPSLVEHLADVPSLVGHGHGPVREAHDFLGTERSALSVDWGAVPLGGLTPGFASLGK